MESTFRAVPQLEWWGNPFKTTGHPLELSGVGGGISPGITDAGKKRIKEEEPMQAKKEKSGSASKFIIGGIFVAIVLVVIVVLKRG
ncbi:MAG: hypothetical protein K8R92_07205 [Planctomycetes bacterium]|nr:hypothetical protein [Planctomycetota bacterium]